MSNISNNERESIHGLWSSRLTFILAVTGSAIGLGNIWKFPYVAGANGGGAFVLVYLICILIIGFPIMVSEILIGRKGRRNPITSMQLLGKEETGSQSWMYVRCPLVQWLKEAIDGIDEGRDEPQRIRAHRRHFTLCDIQQQR